MSIEELGEEALRLTPEVCAQRAGERMAGLDVMSGPEVERLSLEAVKKQWPSIVTAYKLHEKYHPIIQYVLPDEIIYSFPAEPFIDNLSLRTREETRKQYRAAVEAGKFIVFVRDNARLTLKSYSFEVPKEDAGRAKRRRRS